jgi:hypothetical protein
MLVNAKSPVIYRTLDCKCILERLNILYNIQICGLSFSEIISC